jgi:hypothetical protein
MLNLGSIGIVIAALVALVALWQGDRAVQRSKGEQVAVAKMEKKANANAQKAQTARRSADQLPADGLRDRYTRD